MGTLEYSRPSRRTLLPQHKDSHFTALRKEKSPSFVMRIKCLLLGLGGLLVTSYAAPVAKPEADPFFNAAIALPSVTGNALIDGLLLGKLAFLKSAIIANILLNLNSGADEADAGYGAPAESYGAPVDSYGAPAVSYEEPAPAYGAPVEAPAPAYDAPAPAPAYEEPAEAPDAYGAPAAPVVDSYGSPAAPAYSARQ